jgi:hypothetical protein
MFTKEQLIAKYENYSDEELLEIYADLQDYSEEARDAFNVVLAKRGGEETLIRLKEKKFIHGQELHRIEDAVARLTTPDVDPSFLKKMITSDIFGEEEMEAIIINSYLKVRADQEDVEVKPNTIYGSVFGGIIASIVGGIFVGLQFIFSNRIFIILIFGAALLCYWIIYLFTKKSIKNPSVLITTVISFVIAMVLGKLLYLMIGYQG